MKGVKKLFKFFRDERLALRGSVLAAALALIGVLPSQAYKWEKNPANIAGITINNGVVPTANVCDGNIVLTNGVDNATFKNADDQVVYLYEVSTGSFMNANGHNGTGAGLLDVGAAIALQKVEDQNASISGELRGGANETGYHFYTNFVVKGGGKLVNAQGKTYDGTITRNKLGFTFGNHGDGLFFDRGHGGDDVNDDWSFMDAGQSEGTNGQGKLQEVYIYSNFDNGNHKKDGYWGTYFISIRPDALDNPHFAFDIVKSDDGKAPEGAAKFIIVTRGMLRAAFADAANSATVDNPVDATWQMYDEDFIRTQAGHTGVSQDEMKNHKWKISANVSDAKFWPIGEDGASGNQYIGNAETDATFDYDRFYGVKLPNAFQGKFYQNVQINTDTKNGGYAGWYKFSVKGISSDTGNSLYATANGTTQSTDLLDVNYFTTDNSYLQGSNPLAYQTLNDNGYTMAYYANADQNKDKYFRRVFEAETAANTIDNKNYSGQRGDGSNHNSENANNVSALIAHNGNPIDFTFDIPTGCGGNYIVTAIAKNCEGKSDITVNINAGTDDAQTINITGADNKAGTFLLGAKLHVGSNTISFKSNTTDDLIMDRMIVEKGELASAEEAVTTPELLVNPAVDANNNIVADMADAKAGNTIYSIKNGANVKSNSGNHDALKVTHHTDRDIPYFGNVGMGNYFYNQYTNRKDQTQLKKDFVKANGGDNEIYFKLPVVPNEYDDDPQQYIITLWGYCSGTRSVAYVGFNDRSNDPNHNDPKPWYQYINHPDNYKVTFTDKDGKNPTFQGVQFTATLRGSQNIMSIGCGDDDNRWAPDISYVTIQKVGDASQQNKSDGIINDNGNKYVTLPAGNSFEFNVNTAASGDYHVALWYANDKEAKVSLSANGKVREMTIDKSYNTAVGRGVISPYTFLHLNAGDNKITVTNESNVPINITDVVASPGVPAELELGQDIDNAVRSKAASVVLYLDATDNKGATNVELGIDKTSTSNPVFFDAFRIDYLGDTKAIVLDENETNWNYFENQRNQAYSQNRTYNNTPVCLIHTFTIDNAQHVGVEDEHNKGQWTTIALPFDVYRNPLTVAFGTYVKVAKLVESPGTTINFQVIDLNAKEYDTKPVIEKGKPYFIKVATEGNTLADGDINRLVKVNGNPLFPQDKNGKYTKKFYSLFADLSDGKYLTKADLEKGDVKGVYDAGKYTADGHDGAKLQFVPVLYRTKLPTTGVYIFNNGSLGYYTTFRNKNGEYVPYNIFGFRGYLVDQYQDPQGARQYYFDNTATGIIQVVENIDADDAKSLLPTDNKVYNLNGQQVQANELQRGVYIRNGRKFIVK